MFFYRNQLLKIAQILSIAIFVVALLIVFVLTFFIININNDKKIESLLESKLPALPTKVLSRDGELITEFYSDERREIVNLDLMPDYLVKGVIAYEDSAFYHHHGINPFAIIRALIGNLFGRPISGASTLTQQLARTLFLTHKFSWARKINEIFIAFQLEKKFSKNEILTLYLNHVPLGHGTNGVEAASRYYFNKDVWEISVAEAASLITVISNPTFYSLINFPKNHMKKQRLVLKKMISVGLVSKDEAEKSFKEFWEEWFKRPNTARGAFFTREDKAPFFSDWVLQIIQKELPNINPFKDGLTIYTTLDLKWQKYIEKVMNERLEKQQKIFEEDQMRTFNAVQNNATDSIELLSNVFSLINVKTKGERITNKVLIEYNKNYNAPINLISQMFGLKFVDVYTEKQFRNINPEKNLMAQVQGAFIVMDNKTGQILVLYGGRNFDPNNRFNYAMQAKRQPGSAIKPLFYSAAFDEGIITPGDIINDRPYIFTFGSENEEDWYKPINYGERFLGRINVRRALRRSLNIPALKVFYAMRENNYKSGIDRAALLLGINSQAEIEKRIPAELSTVLGTCSVSPIEMTVAFSVFANLGKKRIPNFIIEVRDRDGKVIYSPWKELEKYYRENEKKLQIISEANAFIMTNILKETLVADGTLSFCKHRILTSGLEWPDVEIAAKTGTTQNWSDGWVIGYSPLITATAWVGFKEYGLSLGYEQPGANVLGPLWTEFMRVYHLDYKNLKFPTPQSGFISMKICRKTGLKATDYCEDSYYEYFIPPYYPKEECDYCKTGKKDYVLDFFEKKYLNEVVIVDTTDDNIDKSLVQIQKNIQILPEFKAIEPPQELKNEIKKIELFDERSNLPDNTSTSVSTDVQKENKILDTTSDKR